MRVVVLERIPEDVELRQAWNDLVLRMEQPEVFYTWQWAVAVQRAYADQLAPLIFLAYEDDMLVGVAALAKNRKGEIVFLTADTGDYCEFLCQPAIQRAFVEAVFSELKRRKATRIVLTNLPADSPSADSILRASSTLRYRVHMRRAYECAQVRLGTGDARAEVKQTVIGKKRFRRNIRELAKRGTVAFQHETNASEIQSLLPQFVRAHIARFLEMGKISNLMREERRTFLQQLAGELSGQGWIVFSRLLLGDTTAAWNYGFLFAGSWFWYQPAVNDVYSEFSPGYCLLAKIVETACDAPQLRVVDLGLGAEGYKERFANATRETLYCEISRSATRHWRAVLRYRAAMIATASPGIEHRIRSALGFLANMRQRVQSLGFGGMLKALGHRVGRSLFSHDKVLFFEWPAGQEGASSSRNRLEPLGSDVLGAAAVQYGNDPASLRFLIRSAQRLRSGQGGAFVLVSSDDVPLHFCWVKDFQGFEMAELDRKLEAPRDHAVMIFDCFTPESARGQGFFAEAIALLAKRLSSQGKSVWIFGAETNRASVRGIEKSGFRHKFTLGRRRILFFHQTRDLVPSRDLSEAESAPSTWQGSRS